MFGFLNIKGIALDKNQLEKYIENFASDNTITNFSQKQTYPIPRMIENFEFITKVYNLLNEHVKLKVNIHPAGEWLLDNYYIIEENVKTIQKELTLNKYKNFVGLDNTAYRGYARIYVLACQILAYTENNINEANLEFVLKAYQKKKNLSMNEIWNIGTFLKIGLIENIRMVCEKIYSSQIQKYRAHEIFEKFVEEKNKEYQICKIDVKKQTKKIGYGKFKFPFIEYLSYKLKRIGKKGKAFLDILEEQVNMMGMQIQEVIKKEHFEIAIQKVTIGNCILTLKKLSRMNFLEIFDSINGVEEVLKNDPANIYEKMDYETKENYRNEILKLAKKTKISEIYIAQKVIELASNAKQKSLDEEKTHIGYYLISEGKGDLLNTLNIGNKYKKMNLNTKAKIYVYGISVLSVILTIIITYNMYNKINLFILTILSILTFFPISEIVVQIVQYILEKNIKPKQLPKMDYSYGIPKEDATFVVIPTIVNSKEKVQELMHKLEVFYLANKSENIYFALLGDCSTSDKETQNEKNYQNI